MFNRFAAGKKVYGQGSYAPTRGQVDPAGYIQREVKRRNQQALGQPVGNDGQSDSRSGLAGQAMARRPLPPRRPGPVRVNGGANGPMQQSQQSQQGIRRNGPRKPVGNSLNGGNPDGNSQGSVSGSGNPSAVGVPVAPVVPSVQINPTGQLELPYGSDFANQVLDAKMQYDSDMLAMQDEDAQQSLNYQTSIRDLEQGYTDQKRSTLDNSAASGLAFSSAYGTGVNEDSRNYMNAKNLMDSENNNWQTSQANRRNGAMAGLNAFIQRMTQGYADSLAPEAGTLGFGVDEPVNVPALGGGGRSVPGQGGGNPNRPMGNGNNNGPQRVGNGNNNGGNRPPRPSPQHVWRDGRWKKL